MNNLTSKLHNRYAFTITSLLAGKSYLKPEADALFNEVVKKIHQKKKGYLNFINMKDEYRKDQKFFELTSKHFVFRFTIKKNLQAILIIKLIEEIKVTVPKTMIDINKDKGYVYFLKSQFGFKIGKTKNINKRLKTFEVKLPFDVFLHSYISTNTISECEKFFHKLFTQNHINGEWYHLGKIDFEQIEKLAENRGELYINKNKN